MFAEKLKKLRTDYNLSQAALAHDLGVAQNTLSNWEKGNREPDLSTIVKIAEYFDVTTDYLLGRVEKPQSVKKVLPIDGKDVTLTYHKDHEPTDEEAKIAYEAALRALREHHNQD